jgi:DNA-binding NarL/FixJ family response regulator
MIHVLLAVCDGIAEAGLKTVLESADDIRVSVHDPKAGDIPSSVADHDPDVLLLDVAYRRAKPELIPTVSAQRAGLRTIILVDHSEEECGVRHLLAVGGRARVAPEALARVDDCCLTSLRNMALGCITPGATPDAVVAAVRAVSRGEIAAAPWLATVATSFAGGPDEHGHSPISERELEVMGLLADGLSNKQIAKKLDIREQTVKNHVGHLMVKLGVSSRLEAGVLAAKHHLALTDE